MDSTTQRTKNRSPILVESQRDQRRELVSRECLVVLNAVCPTSLDSHKLHCINSASVYIQNTSVCPFKTPLPCPTRRPNVRGVSISHPEESPARVYTLFPLTFPPAHPPTLAKQSTLTPVQSLQCEINSSLRKTQRNHEITQQSKVTGGGSLLRIS